jgi:acetyl esterase
VSKYNLNRDLKKYANIQFPLPPMLLPLTNSLLARSNTIIKPIDGVRLTRRKIPAYQNIAIELSIFEPDDRAQREPCLIYLHGGAFAMKAVPVHMILMCEYAAKTPCKIVFVDYRLAPKYAFPVGLEDCYAAFEWVCQHSEELGIDPGRIAVGGDSAGGALAAGLALMARDRNALKLCFQMLIYPVTDARQITESVKTFTDTPMWNSVQNEKMWKQYLKDGIPGKREYASPMEAPSFANLPPAYVEVSEFDCLRDEGISYAQALQQAGVAAELNKTVGTIHAFEIAMKSEIVRESIARRVDALKRAFYPEAAATPD